MYFGFCNVPATFQAMINEVLKEEIATQEVVIYLDNILIFTKQDNSHHQYLVEKVLQ